MENTRKTFPTPYPELDGVLQDFVESVQTVLGIKFVGAYLQGSFAVGYFDRHSDVDFIMVTEEELSDLPSAHCNTVLVRWVVREHGVPLAGPAPVPLVDPIPVETLREHIRATMQAWGQEIVSHPEHFKNRFYQGFIVLNYC